MKKFGKKIMAFAMVGVMMCTPITASAAPGTTEETTDGASGTTTGSSTVEGYVNPDVFTVVLPVDDNTTPTFDFTLDPQKLLHATESSTYTDADATVLFGTKTGTSDALQVQNKGNVVVDVAVTATASNLSGTGYTIPLTADNTFASDTTTSLYLGLKVGDEEAVALNETSGATVSCSLDGVAEENFEIVKDTTGASKVYKKQLKSGVTDFPSTSFALTGACNGNADWSAATGATPSVSVTWTLTKATDVAPTFTAGGYGTIKYSKGVGDSGLASITSISVLNGGKGYDGYNAGSGWKAASDNGKTIVLDATFMSGFRVPTSTATITYVTNDGTTKTATVTLATMNVAPTFTGGSGVGVINYTVGVGDDAIASIERVDITNGGRAYDAYHAGASWSAATDDGKVITLSSTFLAPLASATVPATITYKTNAGETKTATVDVVTK